MRLAFAFAALVLSGPALANESALAEMMEGLFDVTPGCFERVYGEGTPITSDKEQIEACQQLARLQQELSNAGYCYANGEWKPCE